MASFDRRGDRIVTGSSKGKLLVFDTTAELSLLCTIKLVGTAIKSIEFARRGRQVFFAYVLVGIKTHFFFSSFVNSLCIGMRVAIFW